MGLNAYIKFIIIIIIIISSGHKFRPI